MRTTCGDTSEYVSAGVHGLVALLYLAMLVFHAVSTATHLGRARG